MHQHAGHARNVQSTCLTYLISPCLLELTCRLAVQIRLECCIAILASHGPVEMGLARTSGLLNAGVVATAKHDEVVLHASSLTSFIALLLPVHVIVWFSDGFLICKSI